MTPLRRSPFPVAAVVLVLAAALWLFRADPPPAEAPADPLAAATVAPTAAAPRPAARAPGVEEEETASRFAQRAAAAFDAGSSTDPDAGAALIDGFSRAQLERLLSDNAAAAAKHVDAYCSATKDLVGEQDQRTRKNDAAHFLGGRADWEDGRAGLLHLASSLTQRMANPPGAWRRMGPEAYAGLDFSWMKALLQFDHWSMMTTGPLHDRAPESFFEAPLPNFVSMQNWAKLRLLKGLHEGDLAAASGEVRHLAELCGTTGTLVGDMIRVSLLGIERGFYEEHRLPNAPAITQAEAQRLRASSFAGINFLLPGVDAATRAKALKCLPNRCTALVEAIGMTASMRDLQAGAREQLQWLMSQPQCDPALAEMSSRSPPSAAKYLLDGIVAGMLEEHMQMLLDAGVP